MTKKPHAKAFTLVELLVSLIVTGILLSAVATVAYAVNVADQTSDDTVGKQAYFRQAVLRISELVRHCRLIGAAPGNDLVVWQADDNGDGLINVNELVYIERSDTFDTLRLRAFHSADNPSTSLETLGLSDTKAQLASAYDETRTTLVPACKNLTFRFDAAPPRTQLLAVSFDLTEGNVDHRYEITVALRSWAGHLLSDANVLVGDDD